MMKPSRSNRGAAPAISPEANDGPRIVKQTERALRSEAGARDRGRVYFADPSQPEVMTLQAARRAGGDFARHMASACCSAVFLSAATLSVPVRRRSKTSTERRILPPFLSLHGRYHPPQSAHHSWVDSGVSCLGRLES